MPRPPTSTAPRAETVTAGTALGPAGGDVLNRLRLAIKDARGWRRHVVAAAAGLVSVLAFAPFHLWPVLALTLPVLVWQLDTEAPSGGVARSAFATGWWFGFGFFFAGLFWIGEAFLVEADKFAWALPFAVTLMPAGLAIFFAAAAVCARAFWTVGPSRVLVLAAAISATEWLRGHILTGFPWNIIGYALTSPIEMMQGAGLMGIYGLTLVALISLGMPLVLAADAARGAQRRRALLNGAAVFGLPLVGLFAYGTVRLAEGPAPFVDGVKMRIVQPSVPQHEKWLAAKQGEIFDDHLVLSRVDGDGHPDDLVGITHVVWPEAAMPFLPLERPEVLAAIGALLPDGTHLVSGGLRREPAADGQAGTGAAARRRAFNSLMVFDGEGAPTAVYDKIHLVPFGEYLPFQATLERIGLQQLTHMRGGFDVGPVPRPLMQIGALRRVAGLVCYEAIFPDEVVHNGDRPSLFFNLTNDGWFGNTTGPRQHFHQARVRAAEQGIPIVRAANNGISALIDGDGRVLARLDLNERGAIDTPVPEARAPTPYARLGDWVFLAMLAFVITAVGVRTGSAY